MNGDCHSQLPAKARPVLVIHGTQDNLIGFWQGQKLFALANQPKQFVAISGAGHNDLELFTGTQYLNAVKTFSLSLKTETQFSRREEQTPK